jgi:hypothetical protein
MRPVSTGANLIAGSATSLITRTAPAAAQPAARPPSAQGGSAAGTLSAPVKLPPVRPTAPRVPVGPPVRPPSGEAAGLLRLGVAAGLGAWIGWNLPDWIDRLVNGHKTIEIDGRCEVKDYADSFLKNLRNEGKDVAMRSLPPTEYSWKLPNGYAFAVRQQASKYGLEIGGELKTPDGKSYPFKLNATGGSTRVFDTDWIAGNERFGQLAIDVRSGATGVNEVSLRFTSFNGYVTTVKLKPDRCDVDATLAGLARFNAGQPSEARRLAHRHLVAVARQHGGDITPGLFDLLTKIRPDAAGAYRNHGSEAIDAITRPLNALRNVGVDMSALQRLQGSGSRQGAVSWFTQQLDAAIKEQRISAGDVANAFDLNLGVPSLRGQAVSRATTITPTVLRPAASSGQRVEILPDKVREQLARNGIVVPFATQTRDGRLFVPLTPARGDFQRAMNIVAETLRAGPARLWWHEATLDHFRGVVVEPRQFPAPARTASASSVLRIDGRELSGEAVRVGSVGGRSRPTGALLQGDLMWGRMPGGEILFWLQGVGTNYPLEIAADGSRITNALDAQRRARELIGNGAATDLRGLDPRYLQ